MISQDNHAVNYSIHTPKEKNLKIEEAQFCLQ